MSLSASVLRVALVASAAAWWPLPDDVEPCSLPEGSKIRKPNSKHFKNATGKDGVKSFYKYLGGEEGLCVPEACYWTKPEDSLTRETSATNPEMEVEEDQVALDFPCEDGTKFKSVITHQECQVNEGSEPMPEGGMGVMHAFFDICVPQACFWEERDKDIYWYHKGESPVTQLADGSGVVRNKFTCDGVDFMHSRKEDAEWMELEKKGLKQFVPEPRWEKKGPSPRVAFSSFSSRTVSDDDGDDVRETVRRPVVSDIVRVHAKALMKKCTMSEGTEVSPAGKKVYQGAGKPGVEHAFELAESGEPLCVPKECYNSDVAIRQMLEKGPRNLYRAFHCENMTFMIKEESSLGLVREVVPEVVPEVAQDVFPPFGDFVDPEVPMKVAMKRCKLPEGAEKWEGNTRERENVEGDEGVEHEFELAEPNVPLCVPMECYDTAVAILGGGPDHSYRGYECKDDINFGITKRFEDEGMMMMPEPVLAVETVKIAFPVEADGESEFDEEDEFDGEFIPLADETSSMRGTGRGEEKAAAPRAAFASALALSVFALA